MADWLNEMVGKITDAGLKSATLEFNGGSLLVTEKAGRVIGCAVDGVDENLFYSGGEIEPGYYGGGDRVWTAPEVAFYWPSLEKAREDAIKWAKTPADVDPGDYRIVEAGAGHVVIRNAGMNLVDGRNSKKISLDVTRKICHAENPDGLPAGVKCMSYSITNELQVTGGDEGAVVGVWDILQVPPRGTLICPLVKPLSAEGPTSYYDPFGDVHVQWDDDCVRYLIDANRRTKMGIKPEDTTGRMGYYRELEGEIATMIVRVFPVLPGLPYVDQPITNDADCVAGGDVLQAYNDDGSYGAFGEMEYHDAGVVVGQTDHHRSGTCVTHVLSGSIDDVKVAGQTLLGVDIRPI
ncbi:DUF6786 family protein [Poriferisphaera sp. WC338]|uniref:DUF6786 family protein n=1 Tax=Poriferisphaera sp. WC338 TaxID=3425129 RepID=UPI003D816F8E